MIDLREQRREWLLIGLLTVIVVLKGVLWSLAFPLWQGPDEDDHYAVTQFVAEMGRLPDEGDVYLPDEVTVSRTLADVGRLPYAPEQRQAFSQTAYGPGELAFAELPLSARSSFEFQATGKLMHATPLYYVLAANVYRLSEEADLLARAQVQRLFAIVVASPLVIVAYLICRALFPADATMRLTIPILVAFQPMITEITAVVSVDGLLILCYSVLILLVIRVLQVGFNWRYGLAIGVVFAIGMLTKPTLSGIAPVIALLVVYDWWRGRGRRKEVVIGTLIMGLTIIVPVGWWMLRSYRLNGDLFYFNPVVAGHRIIDSPFFDYGFFSHMLDYYQSVWGGIFATWWAHFGWLDTALPPWVYTLLRVLTLVALAGLAYRLIRAWLAKQLGSWILIWVFLALVIIVPIVLLQFYDLSFWWQYGNGRGLQGRYWLGMVVPMLIFWVVGLLTWVPRKWQPSAHMVLRIGFVLLSTVSLLGYILPRYYL